MQTQTKAPEIPFDMLAAIQRHAEMLAHLLRGHDYGSSLSTWFLSDLRSDVAERTGKAYREVQTEQEKHYFGAGEYGRYDTDYESLPHEFLQVLVILNGMAQTCWYSNDSRWTDPTWSIPDPAEYYHAVCDFAHTALAPFVDVEGRAIRAEEQAKMEGGDDA